MCILLNEKNILTLREEVISGCLAERRDISIVKPVIGSGASVMEGE